MYQLDVILYFKSWIFLFTDQNLIWMYWLEGIQSGHFFDHPEREEQVRKWDTSFPAAPLDAILEAS